MKANIIDNFTNEEKQAWRRFYLYRTKKLKRQFPKSHFAEIEKKVWLEFLCYKYSILSLNPFHMDPIFYPLANNDFGPDTRHLLNSFNHPSVAKILDPSGNDLQLISSLKVTHAKSSKPLSLYNFYFKRRQLEIKAENPNLTIQEISKQAGAEWRAMTPDDKTNLTNEYYAQFGTNPP